MPDQSVIDSYLAQTTNQPDFLRSVAASGLWVEDQLRELGFTDDEISEWCFKHGRMCFGRDPWETAEKVVGYCGEIMEGRAKWVTYRNQPVHQDIPEDRSLLDSYLDAAKSFCGEKGVHPQVCLVKDSEGQAFHALDLSPEQIIDHVCSVIQDKQPTEFVLGIDRSSRSNQDLEFDDFLSIYWYVNGEILTGIVDYVPAEDPEDQVWRPVNWNNHIWNNILRKEDPYYRRLAETVGGLG